MTEENLGGFGDAILDTTPKPVSIKGKADKFSSM